MGAREMIVLGSGSLVGALVLGASKLPAWFADMKRRSGTNLGGEK